MPEVIIELTSFFPFYLLSAANSSFNWGNFVSGYVGLRMCVLQSSSLILGMFQNANFQNIKLENVQNVNFQINFKNIKLPN